MWGCGGGEVETGNRQVRREKDKVEIGGKKSEGK